MPTDLVAQWQVTRAFSVTNLKNDSDNQAATMLDRALSAKGIPQLGTLAPGAAGAGGAIAISRRAIPLAGQSDEACVVLVSYQNPMPGTPVAFLVSDDTTLTVESTQLHPSNKSVMQFSYKAPILQKPPVPQNANPDNPLADLGAISAAGGVGPGGGSGLAVKLDKPASPEQYQATFRYSRPIRKVSMQAYVINRAADLDIIRNCIGSVNAESWLGYPVGFWRFDDFRNEGILFGNIIKVTCGLSSRVNENWMSWEVFNSPDLGRRVTVNQFDVNTLKALGYFYSWKALNGIIAAGLYPMAHFAKIFGFGAGPGNPGGAPITPTNIPTGAGGGILGGLGA